VIITERKQERHVDRAQRVETPQIAPACPFDLRCLHSLRSVDMTFLLALGYNDGRHLPFSAGRKLFQKSMHTFLK
ncbi:MAG: hypothetical protein LBQ78_01165, partial [Tannerellaceae bacterium]|nr:hypothetical protein [Tannerellaceae bacterium]